MNSVSVYQRLKPDANHTYKLIQLPPSLQNKLEQDTNHSSLKLELKSNKGHDNVVVCTENETFKLRQNNHSNTILLMRSMHNEDTNNKIVKNAEATNVTSVQPPQQNWLVGFAKCPYIYELAPVKGNINILEIPILHPSMLNDLKKLSKSTNFAQSPNKQQLLKSSCCSKTEFQHLLIEHLICEIHGHCFRVSRSLEVEILFHIITFLISRNQLSEFKLQDLKEVVKLNLNWSSSMVYTVIKKYSYSAESTNAEANDFEIVDTKNEIINNAPRTLDDAKIVKLFGIVELGKISTTILTQEFLLNWKTSLPSFYNVPLEITYLLGYYVTIQQGHIQYINPDNLSSDLGTRFKELLNIVKIWPYEEFVSFIEPLVPKERKLDSVIIKYGRKKRLGRDKFVVCGR